MGALLANLGSAGSVLVVTLLSLGLLSAALLLGLRRFSGHALARTRKGRRIEVLDRVALDFKNALYVVRASGRTWLVSSGEGSAPRLLAELEGEAPEEPTP